MHGIGNDFVVVDCRATPLPLDAAGIARLGDRHRGVGFDQLLTIEPARDPDCAFAYGIWNGDGSPALQCGNGVRCVAAWLHRAGALPPGPLRLQGPAGPVAVERLGDGRIRVDMGEPRFAPAAIPLAMAAESDVYALNLDGTRVEFGAVSIGNPHAVIEVADAAAAAVATIGPRLARDVAFPRDCNVGFAEVRGRDAIALRVWERGAGETLACGSGACAAVAVLHRRGRVGAAVRVSLPGGDLDIDWSGPGATLWMTGPAAFVFDGALAL
ncbi:MAG TPA: diaminopimelate epimerase [Dokdonella sp.]|uniref:diaminopimelate epimerase n=1 Tax=Dokdonella sp. TaxID=2291710 RepID=UPI002C2BE922|nr:diaminopimelate epimerase [Dokdonella sp.]HUD43895.1 diaminopimelate epimerase [Dokdonella sp.]